MGGKETDILIRAEDYECVIDCKYKPAYENHAPSLEYKRQLAGYSRLKSIYKKLEVPQHELIRGLIIYSHQDCDETIDAEKRFSKNIEEYVEFYKLGISLPYMAVPER